MPKSSTFKYFTPNNIREVRNSLQLRRADLDKSVEKSTTRRRRALWNFDFVISSWRTGSRPHVSVGRRYRQTHFYKTTFFPGWKKPTVRNVTVASFNSRKVSPWKAIFQPTKRRFHCGFLSRPAEIPRRTIPRNFLTMLTKNFLSQQEAQTFFPETKILQNKCWR